MDFPKVKIIRSKRKTLSIQISQNGELIARAPNKYPENEIEKFISLKTKWIEKQLDKINKNPKIVRNYSDNEEFLLLGKKYQLHLYSVKEVYVDENILYAPASDTKKYVEKWYLEFSKKFLIERTIILSQKFNADVSKIKISKATKRWGSCNSKNSIGLSWRLIMSPEKVIDYVIIHELAHTFHHNHSKKFWRKVSDMMPDYKIQEKWLKDNSNIIIL